MGTKLRTAIPVPFRPDAEAGCRRPQAGVFGAEFFCQPSWLPRYPEKQSGKNPLCTRIVALHAPECEAGPSYTNLFTAEAHGQTAGRDRLDCLRQGYGKRTRQWTQTFLLAVWREVGQRLRLACWPHLSVLLLLSNRPPPWQPPSRSAWHRDRPHLCGSTCNVHSLQGDLPFDEKDLTLHRRMACSRRAT